jgi:hypothetical protein
MKMKDKYIEFKSALANKDTQKAEKVFTQGFNKAIEIFNQMFLVNFKDKIEELIRK